MKLAELDGVVKRFGTVTALDGVGLDLEEGEVLALLGPNGAGKSTAIALLLGLRMPDAGTARLLGLDPRRPAARRSVGVTPQENDFPTTLRVRELIELVGAHYARTLPRGDLVERFALGRLLDRQLGGLSGGERRLVAVALAFVGSPKLAVLDEPTSGLDIDARRLVWTAIDEHASSGGSVLLTTHYLEEAEALATRVILLAGGRVVKRGTVAEIKAAAGLTRVSFRAPQPLELDGAVRDGPFLHAAVPDGGAFVEQLVRDGVRLPDLEVRPLTLEEALRVYEERR